MKVRKHIRGTANERGLITLDFVFAMAFAFGFCSLFFALAVMLSFVEITQYITFATSRAYLGAHQDRDMQIQLGKDKYNQLLSSPVFKGLYGTGWVTLGEEPQLGDFNREYPQGNQQDAEYFVGARVNFDAKILHLSIPFLGPTAEDTNVGKATLSSFLMREVTTKECREDFNAKRFENIMRLYGVPNGNAKLITDNGC